MCRRVGLLSNSSTVTWPTPDPVNKSRPQTTVCRARSAFARICRCWRQSRPLLAAPPTVKIGRTRLQGAALAHRWPGILRLRLAALTAESAHRRTMPLPVIRALASDRALASPEKLREALRGRVIKHHRFLLAFISIRPTLSSRHVAR
jgi:hypothetical protein